MEKTLHLRQEEAITINDTGPAEPYPSQIQVPNVGGRIKKVVVKLFGLKHSYAQDLSVLLVGPNKRGVVLMSRACGGLSVHVHSIAFDDDAPSQLPQAESPQEQGMYQPTTFKSADSYASPAPVGPYQRNLSAFNGGVPKGTWALYVQDDAAFDRGTIAGGWELVLTLEGDVIRDGPPDRLSLSQKVHLDATASREEIALNVNAYANVLARLLRTADDHELCLAVYGEWGQGKSFLAEQTIAALKASTAHGQIYEFVRFSAWRYPSRPEVWIHFYETFRKCVLKDGHWLARPFFTRANVYRYGQAALWWAWVWWVVTLVPKGNLASGVLRWLESVGWVSAATSLVLLVTAGWRFFRSRPVLRSYQSQEIGHSEKLGLQSAVGEDLVALLKGWVRVDPITTDQGVWRFIAATSLLISLAYARSSEMYLLALIFVAVGIGVLFYVCFPFTRIRSPHRVLLVIDDLDRCAREHQVAVIESIKLLLENEEVSKRVQVLVLIEEDAFRHAIRHKYRHLSPEGEQCEGGEGLVMNQIVESNLEKLFVAHLRLEALDLGGIESLVMLFGSGNQNPQGAGLQATEVRRMQPSPNENIVLTADEPRRPLESALESAVVTALEKEYILENIYEIRDEGRRSLTPRLVRSIMFRYQLARLLLQETGFLSLSPPASMMHKLAKIIVERTLTGRVGFEPEVEAEKQMVRVAEMVG